MLEERSLAEAGDRAVLGDLDDAEGRTHLRDDERPGGAARLMLGEERAEVDVEQLVAVEGQHRSLLPASRRREPKAAAAAERLVSPTASTSAPSPDRAARKVSSSPARHATITRVTPQPTSRATVYAASGLPPTGTSGFGSPCAASPSLSAFPPPRRSASTTRSSPTRARRPPAGRPSPRSAGLSPRRQIRARAQRPGRGDCARRRSADAA